MRPLLRRNGVYWPELSKAGGAATGPGPTAPLPTRLYAFIWQLTGRDQLLLSLIALLVMPLAMVPLELQRLMVNEAVRQRKAHLLVGFGTAWILVLLLQGGLKYLLNLRRGLVVERIARELRRRTHARSLAGVGAVAATAPSRDPAGTGLLVSLVAAEAEDVAGFVAESISPPLRRGAPILVVFGYLVWVQPLIAALSIVLSLPELVIAPGQQRPITRLGRLHTRLVRRLGIH